jgi:hypothetical protein
MPDPFQGEPSGDIDANPPPEDDDELLRDDGDDGRQVSAESRLYDIFYDNYLLHYSLYGRGRPKLSRMRYERLDRELLSLVDQYERQGTAGAPVFTREMFNRVRDLEYLLMDDIAEVLLETRDVKKVKLSIDEQDKEKPDSSTTQPMKLAFHWSDDSRGLSPR